MFTQRTSSLVLVVLIAFSENSFAADYKNFPALGKFMAHIRIEVFICHLAERVVALTGQAVSMMPSEENQHKQTEALEQANQCVVEAKKKAPPLYSAAAAQVRKKVGAEAKLKAVLSAWLSIMSAIPRAGLNEYAVQAEHEKDDRLLREKIADFEAEFFF